MTDTTAFTRFREAVEAHDLDRVMAAFGSDPVLHNPFHQQPFEGAEAVRMLLGHILEVLPDLTYTDMLEAPDRTRAALVFRATVKDLQLEGLDLLRFDEAGRIRDLTVMVRPRSAAEALFAEMAPRVARSLAASGSGG